MVYWKGMLKMNRGNLISRIQNRISYSFPFIWDIYNAFFMFLFRFYVKKRRINEPLHLKTEAAPINAKEELVEITKFITLL